MTHPEHPMYGDNTDAERLTYMATGFANELTLKYLQHCNAGPQDTVLDVGAGPGVELGNAIYEIPSRYVAIDINPVFIDEQIKHHHARLGSATDIPLGDDSVSIVNARFSMSWLKDHERQDAISEFLRVGNEDLRIIVTDYDWSVANGPPAFMDLIHSMQRQLREFGFNPHYGSRDIMKQDIFKILTASTSGHNYVITEHRDAIPAEDEQDKKTITQITAESIISSLINMGNLVAAQRLKDQVELALAEDGNEFVLPSINTLTITNTTKPRYLETHLGRFAANILDPESITKLDRGSADPKLFDAARALFAHIYTKSGYITPAGREGIFLNEATDPQEVRDRSDIFVAQNSFEKVVSTVRLVHPSNDGLRSLPVGAKILDKYGASLLPSDATDTSVGEISGLASTAHNPLVTIGLISNLIATARKSAIKYLLFGAVSGVPDGIFSSLFGPAITKLSHNSHDAVIKVSGAGYPDAGIELKTAYFNSEDYFENMINYYKISNKDYAQFVINLCNKQLDQRAQ